MFYFFPRSKQINVRNLLIFSLGIVIALAGIFIYQFIPAPFSLRVSEIAPFTIRSPRNLSYESDIGYAQLIEQTKENFPASVKTNWSVGPHQKEVLANVLTTLTKVRNDVSFNQVEKRNFILQELKNFPFYRTKGTEEIQDEQITEDIVSLSITEWEYCKGEALRILDQVHQQGILEEDLENKKNEVSEMVQKTFTDAQMHIIVRLVIPFLAVNVIEDPEKTEERLEKTLASLKKPKKTIVQGEIVVKKGEIITAEVLELLEKLDFVAPKLDWIKTLALIGLSIGVGIITFFFIYLRLPKLTQNFPALGVIFILTILEVFLIRNLLPERPYVFYLIPWVFTPLLLKIFIDVELSFWSIGLFSLTLGVVNADINHFLIFLLISCFVGLLLVSYARSVYGFFKIGSLVSLVNVVLLLLIHLLSYSLDFQTLMKLLGVSLGHGFLLSLTLIIGIMYLGNIFNFITHFQLVELANPNHPLMLKLSSQAPGTYHHSVTVAELSQAAADTIAADSLLAKVYALYHDVGKLKKPAIFVENQHTNSPNPLEQLAPEAAARKIIAHVSEGIKIATLYHIPHKIMRAILTHHGTGKTSYFYQKALQKKSSLVEDEHFTYPGELPRNKEESIIMLADAIEAFTRSTARRSPEEIRSIINEVIGERIEQGQLNQSKLTIGDIATIKESFYTTLMGIYHPRVHYRVKKKDAKKAQDNRKA